MSSNFSVVIPAKNESENLALLLPKLHSSFPNLPIIVVDDGSTDDTHSIASDYATEVISHPYSMGNGAAIKSGARACKTEYIIFMDADGQHDPIYIQNLIDTIETGYDMVVGARTEESQANILRGLGNKVYNFIASKVTGHEIRDLTSGFRAVKRELFIRYLYLLPNGFSYPTTITMAFFRSGYSVSYLPIVANKRKGKSHINLSKDGIRFFIIIIKIASLYSPLKVFTPVSVFTAILGLSNYAYTYIVAERFTNMSALLFIVSIIIFMLGLLAEQITVLTYAASERRRPDQVK
ncbi:MAG: glycosyltransferase family 2 protein [Gammaproteobacteria bacterium]|nr:glycosyltransferase family 2 protein [Gammaproteobacteria bacterium]